LPVTGDKPLRALIVLISHEIWSVASVSLKDSCVNQPDRNDRFTGRLLCCATPGEI
jgi:hypothetical protein